MKIKNMKNGREEGGEHGAVRPTPHAGQLAGQHDSDHARYRRRSHSEDCKVHRRVVIRVHRAGPHRVSLPGSVRPPIAMLGTRVRIRIRIVRLASTVTAYSLYSALKLQVIIFIVLL